MGEFTSLFIFSLILLIIALIYLYKNRYRGWKNIHNLEQATRHFNKLLNIDSHGAKEEMRKMLDKIAEQKMGRKMTDEEFKEAFKTMREGSRRNV